MSWGDNGVTNVRIDSDQNPAFSGWGSSSIPINFNPLNPVGYLRKLYLKIPSLTVTITEAANNNTGATNAEKDWPVERAIGGFSLIAQGIAPLYQLSLGAIDLLYLNYVGNGRMPWGVPQAQPEMSNASTNTLSLGHTSDQWAYRRGVSIGTQQGAGPYTQALQYAEELVIPLTEWVQFPAGVMQGPNGPVPIPGQWAEVGMLTAQNTQTNLRPAVTLNPLYILTGGNKNAVLLYTTAIPPASTASGVVQIYKEFYDVPTDPANQPPPFSQQWVITRQTRDWPVSANAVFPKFEPAGLLMSATYVFLDANNTIVDVSGQATDGTIAFKWGSSVYKENAIPFELNLGRAQEMYGAPPPAGALFHDFFLKERNTLTDLINTAELPSVSAEIRGLPGSVTTCHVIERRMVPVRTG